MSHTAWTGMLLLDLLEILNKANTVAELKAQRPTAASSDR